MNKQINAATIILLLTITASPCLAMGRPNIDPPQASTPPPEEKPVAPLDRITYPGQETPSAEVQLDILKGVLLQLPNRGECSGVVKSFTLESARYNPTQDNKYIATQDDQYRYFFKLSNVKVSLIKKSQPVILIDDFSHISNGDIKPASDNNITPIYNVEKNLLHRIAITTDAEFTRIRSFNLERWVVTNVNSGTLVEPKIDIGWTQSWSSYCR